MKTEPLFISGTPSAINVEVGTELDIAAAVAFLRRKAERLGEVPLEVQLSPMDPRAGWIAAAKRFVRDRKKERHEGRRWNARNG